MFKPDQTQKTYRNLWVPPPERKKPQVLPVEMLKAMANSPAVQESRARLLEVEKQCLANNWKLRGHQTGWTVTNKHEVVSMGLWTTPEEYIGGSWMRKL